MIREMEWSRKVATACLYRTHSTTEDEKNTIHFKREFLSSNLPPSHLEITPSSLHEQSKSYEVNGVRKHRDRNEETERRAQAVRTCGRAGTIAYSGAVVE
jgi:hypothetical protein